MKDEVVELKEEIQNLRKDYNNSALTLELLREVKTTSKRKDIIIIILIGVIVAMIITIQLLFQIWIKGM
jgi:hypothetical protein